MKTLLLIPSSFPYDSAEPFLDVEVGYFSKNRDLFIKILPTTKGDGTKREIPPSVILDDSLCNQTSNTTVSRMFYLLRSLGNRVFYRELFFHHVWNFTKMKYFLLSISRFQMFYELLDDYLSKLENTEETIIYTYWHTEPAYALQYLKHKYRFKLISRIHGSDLYEQSRASEYMPLKRQFVENIDAIFTITQSAHAYLSETYHFSESILKLARLGVEDKDITSSVSSDGCLNIVSCSYLKEVKQIDKIIDALVVLAKKVPFVQLKWTHIGDGELYDTLVASAEEKLHNILNVDARFLGKLSNKEVYAFYKEKDVDVFVNVSHSEGVPVSIMEAMSCHIPVVAPDVGGISDMLIDRFNGRLLSSACTIDEIVTALEEIGFFKDTTIRDNAYKVYLEKYDAKTNYTKFIETLLKL